MKKILKIVLIVIMILGIAFSIFNFVSIKTEALNSSDRGAWVIVNGNWECGGDGNECDIEGAFE
jgi:hypothetical protein